MTKIGAVMLYVGDFDTALELYRDTGGLDVADIDPGAGYRPLVDFAFLTSDRAALEIFDRATHGSGITDFVLSNPEGNRLQVYKFAR